MSAPAPPESLTASATVFLRRHPPFDAMEEEALRFIASRLALGYYPAKATILSPDHGEPQFLYIIRHGRVQAFRFESHDPDVPAVLAEGECFSVGALLERRPTASRYTAAADTFCYQLGAQDFAAVLDSSRRFREFSREYLASLLRDSRRLLRMSRAGRTVEQQAMNRTLRSLIHRPAVRCGPATSARDALQTMHRQKTGSIVIVHGDGLPVGIFTRHDVLDRVALAGSDLAAPISTVMTPSPHVLSAEATAHDAALLIAREGVRHIPVVDDGRLVGVVTERDLFALQRVSIRGINRTIAVATRLPDLQQAAEDIRRLAREMIGQGIAAESLTVIVSALNDALTGRILEVERERHDLAGITWGWLAFGSEGRYEQTIATDQDNGIIFDDDGDEPAERLRERLLPFARSVNAVLDACGYPLCKGGIMAGNPAWCLGAGEWRRQFESWIANTDPQTLLKAAIFFDFRAIHGGEALATALRLRLLALTAATPRFLRQMAEQAIAVRPPLGVLVDFVTDDAVGATRTLDLKKSGARLFVDAARILALAAGVPHTATAQRLRQTASRLSMSDVEMSAAVDAFHFIQMMRLRDDSGAAPNRIRPDSLNEIDRRMLKESLRQARKLQERLALDYRL